MPHYASLAPSPKAALALCTRLSDLLGAEIDFEDLQRAADAYERQVTEAVAQDEDTEAYVHELEHRRDTLGDEIDMPSGDALAEELTRFLREHEARNEGRSGGRDLARRLGRGRRRALGGLRLGGFRLLGR